MSYDESQAPARRPFSRSTVTVALAALVAGGLAGWLVWQGTNGSDGGGPPAAMSPHGGGAAGSSPSSSPSGSPGAPGDDEPGDGDPAAEPLAGKLVVIDPGHNPHNAEHTAEINKPVKYGNSTKECDTTGTSTNDGYAEARFTLDVAHRVRALLEKQGAKVQFTQDDDRPWGPCVDERAEIGNKAKADAALSIHADGAPEGDRGFHVILPALVKGGGADTSEIVAPSRALGKLIVGTFADATGTKPSNYIGAGTGLDVRKDLGGLTLSTVPKVMVECGNMRDPKDAALVKSAAWRQKAAEGLAEGVSGFLAK